jgi:hypothetical protein
VSKIDSLRLLFRANGTVWCPVAEVTHSDAHLSMDCEDNAVADCSLPYLRVDGDTRWFR